MTTDAAVAVAAHANTAASTIAPAAVICPCHELGRDAGRSSSNSGGGGSSSSGNKVLLCRRYCVVDRGTPA